MIKQTRFAAKSTVLLVLLSVLLIFAGARQTQAQLTLTGTSYIQTFDSVGSGLPTGWSSATGASASSIGTGASFTTAATSWSTTNGQFANYASATGEAGTESASVQSADTNRLFGERQTSPTDPGAAFRLELANTTGFSGFTLSLDLDVLAVGARVTTWDIEYGVGATPTSFTTLGTFVEGATFGVTTDQFTIPSDIDNQGLPVWIMVAANNASSGSGTRDAFGIDNVSLTYSNSNGNYTPKNLTWTGGTGKWNSTDSNWLVSGSASSFTNTDNVTFDDINATPGTVTVDPAGVSSGNILVSNTTGTYIFTGGTIAGPGALTKTGAGTLALSNANSFSGGVNFNGGLVKAASDSSLGIGALAFASGTLQATASIVSSRGLTMTGPGTVDTNGFDSSFAGVVSGSGLLTKAGQGMLTIASSTGGLAILGGTLNLNAASGTIVVNPGGPFAGDLLISGSVRANLGAGTIAGGGRILLQEDGAAIADTGTGLFTLISNNIVLNNLALPAPFVGNIGAVSSDTIQITGTISGASDLNFSTTVGFGSNGGAGTIILGATNTYTGKTTLNFSSLFGVLQIGVSDALPTATDLAFNKGVFDMNGFNQTVASLGATSASVTSGTGQQITNNGPSNSVSVLTINGSIAATNSFLGPITDGTNGGKVALVKDGSSALTMNGNNYTYSGGTTIKSGALVVNGGIAGSIQVNSTGQLLGSGSVGGLVSVASGGVISPGATGYGVITLKNGLDLSAGGSYTWQLGDLTDNSSGNPGSDFGQISLTGGNLTLGGNSTLTLDFSLTGADPNSGDPFWTTAHVWTILSLSGGATNSGNSNFVSLVNANFNNNENFTTTLDPTTGSILLDYSPVPEPSTFLLAGVGIIGFVGCRRSLRRRA